MFNNPGKALKIVGKTFFWLFVLAGTFCGIVLGAGVDEMYLLMIPAGIVSGFLIALPICAFGTLVENSEVIRANSEAVKADSGSIRSTVEQTADVCMDIHNSINRAP